MAGRINQARRQKPERGTEEEYFWVCLGPIDPVLGIRGVRTDDKGAVTPVPFGCGWAEPAFEEEWNQEGECPNCGEMAMVRTSLSPRDEARALAVAAGVPPAIAMAMVNVGPELPEEGHRDSGRSAADSQPPEAR